MGTRPRAVAVFCKPRAQARGPLQRVAEELRRRGVEMLFDENAREALGLERSFPRERAVELADLVVSVGGDGTLLAAARAVGARETPIVGVNLGSLGFLTETRCEDVSEVLDAALEGRATIEERRALQMTRDGEAPRPDGLALNDVVLGNQTMARLTSLSLAVDDEWVTDFRADGLIVSTPTGSTAYNLAAGGPLVCPSVDALVATPICPHSLSQRPLILPGNAKVSIRLAEGQPATDIVVTLDGQVSFPLAPGETILLSFAAHRVRLIHPGGQTFFSTLRNKLGWGHP
ncbi:MAG: NAD(+)/NADH kinase [Candidatus Polarisedimenticolia bacterium]|nr:NAD(+)/NADH kinase [bacterium]